MFPFVIDTRAATPVTCGGRGFAIRKTPGDLGESLEKLLRMASPIPTRRVEADTPDGTARAIALTAARDFPLHVAEPAEDDIVDISVTAVGHGGTMAAYLLNMAARLEALE